MKPKTEEMEPEGHSYAIAERAVIGCSLASEVLVEGFSKYLDVEDFRDASCRIAFAVIIDMFRAGESVDVVTVSQRMRAMGSLDKVGGAAWLASLDVDVSLHAAKTYMQMVSDGAAWYAIARISEAAFELHANPSSHSVLEAVDALSRRVEKVRSKINLFADLQGERGLLLEDLSVSYIDSPEGAVQSRAAYGIGCLDGMLGGLWPGQLIVIGARPGVGKTVIALNVSQNVAIDQGLSVAFFSLEMTEQELAGRVISSRSGVPLEKIRSRKLSEADWIRVHATSDGFKGSRLTISSKPLLKPSHIRDYVSRASDRGEAIDLVIVDYLQLVTPEKKEENRNLEVGSIASDLKRLALEFRMPVIALSQLSRDSVKGVVRRPGLPDLRESGNVEQDADVVVLLHPEQGSPKEVTAIVEKHRNGPTGDCPLAFVGSRVTFHSLAEGV